MNRSMKYFVALFSFLILFSCKQEQKQQQAPPPPALPTVEAQVRDVVIYQSYPVSIEGKVNNAVRAKISGYITNVYVDEGQYVSKGQPLFKLETNVQSQDAKAARSAVNAAQANIEAAQAAVNAAQVEVNKLIPLVERNIISNVQLETAKANLQRAQGQLAQSKAAKSQSQAAYSASMANINFGVVRSPISGVVGAINMREGSLVGPGDPNPITTVSETSDVFAYFSMNESEYFNFLEKTEGKTITAKLNNLPEVELILPNGQTYQHKGKIHTVTGQINPQTGTIQFRATFPNKEKLLSNGNSGVVRIPEKIKGAIVVPESATFEQQGATYVYQVFQDSVTNTPVKLLSRENNLALITSGIKAGDKVVTEGVSKLKPGAKIKGIPTSIDSIVQAIKPIF